VKKHRQHQTQQTGSTAQVTVISRFNQQRLKLKLHLFWYVVDCCSICRTTNQTSGVDWYFISILMITGMQQTAINAGELCNRMNSGSQIY